MILTPETVLQRACVCTLVICYSEPGTKFIEFHLDSILEQPRRHETFVRGSICQQLRKALAGHPEMRSIHTQYVGDPLTKWRVEHLFVVMRGMQIRIPKYIMNNPEVILRKLNYERGQRIGSDSTT